ncbi:PCC domain-containing protein [Acidocella facilis]|uniref:PCC domain-containing protein n=1 Tax=Acidocella facilis TaxID=525 RepID=UPI001F3E6CD8|nr:DUF296 domain-containing protein [Acidocella facilis]
MSASMQGLLPEGLSKCLRQPGTARPTRIESFRCAQRVFDISLQPGLTLAEAVGAQAARHGITAGAVTLQGAVLEPMRFVLPAYAETDRHVAYYSATHAPEGPVRLEAATASFGCKDGAAFLHCHALWRDAAGRELAGHILPNEARLAAPLQARLTGTDEVSLQARFDPETNFTLFRPEAAPGHGAAGGLIVAQIGPNEDFISAIETICQRHGLRQGRVLSGIGSLIGVKFADGREIPAQPSELLVLEGEIRPGPDGAGMAEIEIVLVDVAGRLHRGRPAKGLNPVLICAELFIADHAGDPPAETARSLTPPR